MFLLMRTHSSNEHADTPDYAAVEVTPFLAGLALARIALLTRLKAEDRDALYLMEYFDTHCEYRTWDQLFAADLLANDLKTRDGEDAEEVVDHGDIAIVEALPPVPTSHDALTDPEHGLDCHTMVVTTDSVRWTCLYQTFGGDVTLKTADVPLRLLHTLHEELIHGPAPVPEL